MKCPHCKKEIEFDKNETHVDCAYENARHNNDNEPTPICTFALFINHDPRRFRVCGKLAVQVDSLFPVYWEHNRCEEHVGEPVELSPEI